jgi:hypothetical protein
MLSQLLYLATLAGPILGQSYLEIPDYTWRQHLSKSEYLSLYGSTVGSQVSPLKWGECASTHAYDMASGKSTPASLIVGQDVSLDLDVIFNEEVDVKGLKTEVMFTAQGATTPILLYSQDMPGTHPGKYEPGDEYQDSVKWLIPSFAPLGHYSFSVKVHNGDYSATYACLTADFDIYS